MNLNPRSCSPSKSIPAPRISQKIDVPKPKIAANRAVAGPYFFQKPVKKINATKASNKKIPAIWFQDYAVLPQFKGKGLGSFLCKEWMKICPNQMAICSPDSLRVLKKLGWKDNFETEIRIEEPLNIVCPKCTKGKIKKGKNDNY